ncbi:MAG: hypothetical protein A3C06_01145 [Candidatus Taylorbacteria bacterium RIFCSPHIGHO2_02_FULL_46_13]|uniref:Uncharacterized protein n=1 Tax=Candidatus Taylorbacteria bacterium RIFCSPHIGHO2_02_FULL_46_13 TaxID=1802312 RepID=A0A1G2MT98_9BACT|nr:MAG: hypothetical protein A3C06_01145 [Candidatus Taylorbacteria bacterium RIFCSPHIGHO2_02_FULL_46_13]
MKEQPEQPQKHPSQIFYEGLDRQWREDPVEFVDTIWDHVDSFDRMGSGPQYVHSLIESGKIPSDKFDEAATKWLGRIETDKIVKDLISQRRNRQYPIIYKLNHLLQIVMPNRKGETKFPKTVEWFKTHKDALLSIAISDDGGHWENSLKRILREYI